MVKGKESEEAFLNKVERKRFRKATDQILFENGSLKKRVKGRLAPYLVKKRSCWPAMCW